MKIKQTTSFLKFFLGKNTIGITLAPFGIYINEDYFDDTHEKIHWKQQIEMLIIPFYIWYLLEWFFRTVIYKKNAYKNLSFERESYINENDIEYLKKRKHFSSMKYLFNLNKY